MPEKTPDNKQVTEKVLERLGIRAERMKDIISRLEKPLLPAMMETENGEVIFVSEQKFISSPHLFPLGKGPIRPNYN